MNKGIKVFMVIILAAAVVLPIFSLASPANAKFFLEVTEVATLPSPSSGDGSLTQVGSLVINMIPERAAAINGQDCYLRLPAGYKLDVDGGGISMEGQDSTVAQEVYKKNDFDNRVSLIFENITPAPGADTYQIMIPLQIYIPSGINGNTHLEVFVPSYGAIHQVIVARSSATTSTQPTEPAPKPTNSPPAGSTYRMSQVAEIEKPGTFGRILTPIGSLIVSMAPDAAKAANGQNLYLSLPLLYDLDVDAGGIRVLGQDSGAPAVSAAEKNEMHNAVALAFNNLEPAPGASTFQIEIPLKIFVPHGFIGDSIMDISAPSGSVYSSARVVVAHTPTPVYLIGEEPEPTANTTSAGSTYSMTRVATLPSPSSSDGSCTAIGSLVVSMGPDTARAANGLKLYLSPPPSPDGYKLDADIDSVRAEGQDSGAPAVYANKKIDGSSLILTFNNMAPAPGAVTYQVVVPLKIYVPGEAGGDIQLDIAVPSSSKYSSDRVVVAKSSSPRQPEPEEEPTEPESDESYRMTKVVNLPSPSTSDGSYTSVGSLIIKMKGEKAAAANGQHFYLNLPSTPAGYKLDVDTDEIGVEGQDSGASAVQAKMQRVNDQTLNLVVNNISPKKMDGDYQIKIPIQVYIPGGVSKETRITVSAPSSSMYPGGYAVVARISAQEPPVETEPTDQKPTTAQPSDQPASKPTVMRFAIGSTDYRVNDQAQTMDTAAVIKEERTLLPIRYVATPLGASVDWKAEEKKAVISINGKTIELRAGQNTALVNGVEVMIDPGNMNVSPEVVPPGRIILPLRFIAENLGCEVEWDSDRRTVTVTGAKP